MRRLTLALILAVLGAGLTAPSATSADGAAPRAVTNRWLGMRVMDMAHSGGENEAPTNTMYAMKRAARLGADMLELDVQVTKDDRLVVIHNATVDQTTNGTGNVRDLTAAQIGKLDAAYDFKKGDRYPFRGVRTGKKPAPAGYQASDFRHPTLGAVLRRFPTIPINIEIKGASDTDVQSFLHGAQLLSHLLNANGRTDIIVASFNDAATAEFHRLSPKIGTSPGIAGIAAYFATGAPLPKGTVALQIPVQQQGIKLATPEFVAKAHADGYAVHIWFSGTAVEDWRTYNDMINTCADGLMPARPTLLERILANRHIERPGQPGVHPCP